MVKNGHPTLRGLLWPELTCGEEHKVKLLKPQDNNNLASMDNLGWFDYKRDYIILKRSTSPILVTDIDLVICEREASSCMFFQVQFDTKSEETKRQFCFTREQDHCASQTKEPEEKWVLCSSFLNNKFSYENLKLSTSVSHESPGKFCTFDLFPVREYYRV